MNLKNFNDIAINTFLVFIVIGPLLLILFFFGVYILIAVEFGILVYALYGMFVAIIRLFKRGKKV